MVFHFEYDRTIPERRPQGHQPAAPRHALRWTKPITAIISDYFAIQGRDLDWEVQEAFFRDARRSFAGPDGPETSEIMRTRDEAGYVNAVIVGYWTDPVKHARFCLNSPLLAWLANEARLLEPFGSWRETVSVPYDRHETIYSENWYRIGIGRTADSVVVPITTNGFFGAARDRIPLSAVDPLESPFGASVPRAREVRGKGQRLFVQAPLNMVTLRSGQYWAHADIEQLTDYVENMRPRLMTGMNYLLENKEETGTLELRVLTNLEDDGTERRETSVVAHFLSLAHLEQWAASHKTHLDIYRHAIAMNRKYKEERRFVSWHELFVSQSAIFEYVNCHPGTGLLPYFDAIAGR
ncbi:putative phenylacetaldoxime dehydratase (plasmid) [Sinorhizobium fredii HH103]|uniref:Phenylacetaldoxime dehydratase n=1 Tax=Sinorhizobium fredii (strain HH103) TaxID=1117943 RepID=G9AIT9_SINF1|nr:phenylacetaldoxime dehydratase family protein [Sinorhizobium fredii]CCF00971.1 putative phenylacetaldoxime dehydratase [Sinorhizobium fredii HH103]